MKQEIQLNEHNKQEYPPMHTAGTYLKPDNGTDVRMSQVQERAHREEEV